MVDIREVFTMETEILMLEGDYSFTYIQEVFLLVVIILVEETHYRCNFRNQHYLSNLLLISHLVRILFQMENEQMKLFLYIKFVINLVIRLMLTGIGTLRIMWLNQGILAEEEDLNMHI